MKGNVPIEIIWVFVAMIGGVARYLNSYISGQRFKLSIFLASGVVAGFSGYMFAIAGDSLQLPQGIVHMMAGVGGFFGEQTMKFLLDYAKDKVK